MANPGHLQKLQKEAKNWTIWLTSYHSKSLDLIGATLCDLDLSGIELDNANMNGACLSRTDLSGNNLESSRFNKAELIKVKLDNANLKRTRFKNADLTHAQAINACLYGADMEKAEAVSANFEGADFSEANLCDAVLSASNFQHTKFYRTKLYNAIVQHADFTEADLSYADFMGASLIEANFSGANLNGTNFYRADLRSANFSNANLEDANFENATLGNANFHGANLKSANLTGTNCVETDFTSAIITGCKIYGIGAWNLKLDNSIQEDLVITKQNEPVITVDNLVVAQFIYLLLSNKNIRDVIDSITSKGVLILGRFADPQRKTVLDGLRDKLRQFDLLPIVFDFDRPTDKDYTETVQTLAAMSMFVIVDITNPKSTPLEMEATVKHFKIPYVPIIDTSVDERPFAMLCDAQNAFHWVLKTVGYKTKEQLLNNDNLKKYIIDPVNKKREELRNEKNNKQEIVEITEIV
jgi:uncharacterized protein YjbI with pentapeptide repeats